MDTNEVLAIARKYMLHLKENNINFQKAYLFGSYSKGNYNEDSDIDIAVILDKITDRFTSQVKLLQLTYGIDTRIEPHPIVFSDFDKNDVFYSEILKYGIEL